MWLKVALLSENAPPCASNSARVAAAAGTPARHGTDKSAGQVIMTAASAKMTVTVALQVETLPCTSLAVTMTALGPMLAQVNVLGETLKSTDPQLSEADVTTWAVVMPAKPSTRFTLMFWQVTEGGVASTTSKVAVQSEELPPRSLAVMVTMVGPSGMSVPATGFCERWTVPQLSLARI